MSTYIIFIYISVPAVAEWAVRPAGVGHLIVGHLIISLARGEGRGEGGLQGSCGGLIRRRAAKIARERVMDRVVCVCVREWRAGCDPVMLA